jgi:hypothetical protein
VALIGKALLGGLLLFVLLIAAIVAFDALGISQGVQAILFVVLIVGSVIAFGTWSQNRIRRTYAQARAALLADHPVAYVCGLETSGSEKHLISSDAQQVVVWSVERGRPAALVRIPRASVRASRRRVQTAMAKKYDGLGLDWPDAPEGRTLRLSLFDDSFWGLVFPLRGARLDAAIAALQRGAAA